MALERNNLTIVSGYWNVKNKYNNSYFNWMNSTLRINMPYVFFGSKDIIDIVKKIRHDLPTHYIELNITELDAYKYKDYIITDPVHCPSVELSIIWLSKLFLIKKASDLNPFQSEFFFWVDAGICVYRNHHPPLKSFDMIKINQLPKHKWIFSSSDNATFFPHHVVDNNHYHYISGTCFILSIHIIPSIVFLFSLLLEEKIPHRYFCFSSDQVLYTHLYRRYGDTMFYKLGDGYGAVINELYTKEENDGESEDFSYGFSKPLLYHKFI